MSEKPKLLSDGRWLRIYQTGKNRLKYESRFLLDSLEIDAQSLIAEWDGLSAREQWEFAIAYISKPVLTSSDERMLLYLMGPSGKQVWSLLPSILIRHSQRDTVLRFLKERIVSDDSQKANYYQAAGIMHAKELESILDRELALLEQKLSESSGPPRNVIFDYIACVEALSLILGNSTITSKIRQFVHHSDRAIAFNAQKVIRSSS